VFLAVPSIPKGDKVKTLRNLLIKLGIIILVGVTICGVVPERILRILCDGWIDIVWDIRDAFDLYSHFTEDD
jgi:hypothetical protein